MRGVVSMSLVAVFCWACGKGEVAVAAPLDIHLENQDSPSEARGRPEVAAWVAIGATASPLATQLSIEEELLGVERIFGRDDGLMLFAGGPNTRGVLVAGGEDDALLHELGELMGAATYPSHFRPLAVEPHAAATAREIRSTLRAALAGGGDGKTKGAPLVVWLAGHGDEVAFPTHAQVGVWGADSFTQVDLAEVLRSGTRPAVLIATQCHGGGFAEALFAVDDACGAFSAPWSLPASGCDPDPDAARTSYGAMLLRALDAPLDLDGDGLVGRSEVHAAAVAALDIDTPSIDVPRLSSQIWLESWAMREGLVAPADTVLTELPEEGEILRSIAARHGLSAASIDGEVETARRRYDALVELEGQRWDAVDAAAIEVRTALWSRWPELESAWHPAFAATFSTERTALDAFFEGDPRVVMWRRLREAVAFASSEIDAAERVLRGFERVQVALHTQRLATLARAEPAIYERFERLRRCERRALPRKRPHE